MDGVNMSEKVPLFVVGLPPDESAGEFLMLKFGDTLEKAKKILSDIIEAKITVETQNSEGTRTHYDVKATITTTKNQLIYTESGWSILKITDKLCRKLEGRLSKHVDNRQRKSIRKRGSS
jgi:ribosome-associated translation inhibitor RaiA|tara:strand:- start:1403 stop:1762 length:360 start_codon:yes stop_codon:yes gene_type:complete